MIGCRIPEETAARALIPLPMAILWKIPFIPNDLLCLFLNVGGRLRKAVSKAFGPRSRRRPPCLFWSSLLRIVAD